MKSRSAVVFACHDSACRPPTSGGTGGSSPKGGSQHGNIKIPHDVGGAIAAALSADPYGQENARGNDPQLSAIYDFRGYHGRPEQLSRADFNEHVDYNPDVYEMWRGINVPDWKGPTGQAEGERIGRDLHDGPTHWAGNGVLGNGTYFAAAASDVQNGAMQARIEASGYGFTMTRAAINKSDVMQVKDALEIADAVRALDDAGVVGSYLREVPAAEIHADMKLAMDGRRVNNVSSANFEVAVELQKEYLKQAGDDAYYNTDSQNPLTDAGRVAAILGYKAMGTTVDNRANYIGTNKPYDYVVVLDRSALTLDENVYHEDGIRVKYPAKELVNA